MHHWRLIYTPSMQTLFDSRNIKPQASPSLLQNVNKNVRFGIDQIEDDYHFKCISISLPKDLITIHLSNFFMLEFGIQFHLCGDIEVDLFPILRLNKQYVNI